jgi:hypothetical protein
LLQSNNHLTHFHRPQTLLSADTKPNSMIKFG